MKTYNGHRSWNAWNVSLWMSSDKSIYQYAMYCITGVKHMQHRIEKATKRFMERYQGQRTPDGAVYNHLSVSLTLEAFME